jgi:peptide/nickel transport system ATP-binding protein
MSRARSITDSTQQAILQLDDWKTWFQTEHGIVKAVDGITLDLKAGVTLGLVGESGSGKTVLSRSILGLLPTRNRLEPGGSISFDGADLGSMSKRERRKLWGAELAMVFQNPMTSLNPVMPIGRQITEVLKLHLQMCGPEARERAQELLASVGIPAPGRRMDEYPHQLSGGMRQRVTIAIALACDPRFLMADEPTTALDVTVQAQILDLLDDQRTQRNMTMILVTHDLGVVAGRTDEVAVMYAGKIVEKAPTKTLFSNVRMPYTQSLMRSIPDMSAPSHTRLFTIPGRPPNLTDLSAGCRFSPRCPHAQEKCLVEEPVLMPSDQPGQEFACWYPVGTPEGEAALERNLSRGVTASGTPMSSMTVPDA